MDLIYAFLHVLFFLGSELALLAIFFREKKERLVSVVEMDKGRKRGRRKINSFSLFLFSVP